MKTTMTLIKSIAMNYLLPAIFIITSAVIFAAIGFMLLLYMIVFVIKIMIAYGAPGLLVATGVSACILLAISVTMLIKLFKKEG